jgi:uncharacterized protein (DUF885 family)
MLFRKPRCRWEPAILIPISSGDHSLPRLKRWEQREDELLGQLKKISIAPIDDRPEALTYKFLQHPARVVRSAFRVCRTELWNVSPTWTGWQASLPVTAGMESTDRPALQQNALARWSQLPKYLDDEIDNLKEGIKLGYTAPKGNVQSVIGTGRRHACRAGQRIAVRADGQGPMRRSSRRSSRCLERTQFRPAIAKYRDFLKTTYLPAAREAIGVSANPNGLACYTAAVKYHATVDMTPKEIHELGLSQMAKSETEMKAIGKRALGIEDPLAILKLVTTDPKYRFKSRDELIKAAESAVARAKAEVPKWFGHVPGAPVIVEPYPAFLEKTAPGGQAVPPTGRWKARQVPAERLQGDGAEPRGPRVHGVSRGVSRTSPAGRNRPRTGESPSVQRYFFLSGFGEGWGLYAERLADEMGLFSSDIDRLGLLSNEGLRAARLVVDSGMHALGWTRQQAIDYVRAHTTETQAAAEAEVDRYIAVPGQATAYMIGNLEIRRLREEARQKLGARFDIKMFHDVVLEDGSLPLWVLREKIERWVAEELKQKK